MFIDLGISLFAEMKIGVLSEYIVISVSLLLTKRVKANMNASSVISPISSKWTALIQAQVRPKKIYK